MMNVKTNSRANGKTNGPHVRRYSLAAMLLLSLVSTANAKLFLLLNIGDTEDRAVYAAAKTLEKARAGSQPESIDSGAARYFVHLPDATMETLSGSAKKVGATTYREPAGPVAASQSTGDIAIGESDPGDPGDTGWIEYRAPAASLMLFSPDGLDEESDIRFEPARVFLRRFSDGSIYLMMTDENGDPPD